MKITVVTKQTRGLKDKKILLRLDLNVPRRGARITNDYKLRAALPTIKLLLAHRASLIIVTHWGEPSGKRADKKKFSVQPLAYWLEKKLKKKITILNGSWTAIAKNASQLQPGQVVMLENIRLFSGETENSLLLGKRLAGLADVYVNDAFAVCHRNHSSVSAIKKFLPSFAGPLLFKEVVHLERARTGAKPLILIMGGAKITTKLPLLKALGPRAQKILMGGALATTILKARGKNIGASLYDKDGLAISRRLSFSNILLPVDVGVAAHKRRLDKALANIDSGDVILDIGPKTVALYCQTLLKAKTIIWNGPVGMFEKKKFSKGTKLLGQAVAKASQRRAFTLVGGGETIEALGSLASRLSWISTGGGASLAYLAGKPMPGLTKIIKH